MEGTTRDLPSASGKEVIMPRLQLAVTLPLVVSVFAATAPAQAPIQTPDFPPKQTPAATTPKHSTAADQSNAKQVPTLPRELRTAPSEPKSPEILAIDWPTVL